MASEFDQTATTDRVGRAHMNSSIIHAAEAGRACPESSLDISFRFVPERLGRAGLGEVLAAYGRGDLAGVLVDSTALQPSTWCGRWQGPGGEDLLDPGSKLLSQELRWAATLVLAQGLDRLMQLTSGNSDPALINELDRFEDFIEKSYAVTLQTLQGVARTVRFLDNGGISKEESALLCESVEIMLKRAAWAMAKPGYAQAATADLWEVLCLAVSKAEECACVDVLEELQCGLAALWGIIDEQSQTIPVMPAYERRKAEVEMFSSLLQELISCSALETITIISRDGYRYQDENLEAVERLAALYLRCSTLLAEERNFDLSGGNADNHDRAQQGRRIETHFADFAKEERRLIRDLELFGADSEAREPIERCLTPIELHLRQLKVGSKALIDKLSV